MRSEDDIRDALEALADTAPDADEVLARVRTRERGERRSAFHTPVLVGLSAIATATAAVAVPLALDLPDSDVPIASTPVRSNPKWQYKFSLELPSGYDVRSWAITPEFQAATVLAPAATWCEVLVYEPNAFDSTRISGVASAKEVNGTVAYSTMFANPASALPRPLPRLAWNWSPDSWATSACASHGGKPDADSELVVAEAVRRTARRMPVPCRIGYLPAGVEVQAAGTSTEPVIAVEMSGGGAHQLTDLTTRTRITTFGGAPAKEASGLLVEFLRASRPETSWPMSISGYPARVMASPETMQLIIDLGSYEVVLSSTDGVPTVPLTELIKIAESMEFAPDVGDESTWFDATVAIP